MGGGNGLIGAKGWAHERRALIVKGRGGGGRFSPPPFELSLERLPVVEALTPARCEPQRWGPCRPRAMQEKGQWNLYVLLWRLKT